MDREDHPKKISTFFEVMNKDSIFLFQLFSNQVSHTKISKWLEQASFDSFVTMLFVGVLLFMIIK